MTVHPSVPEIEPFYNDRVVAESGYLTTNLGQYWRERQGKYEEEIERLKPFAAYSEAERRWGDFCIHRTGFLKRLLKAGARASGEPLRVLWDGNIALAREARLAFEREARIELWIPYQRAPLKFVSIGATGHSELRESSYPTGQEHFEIGKAYITVFLRDTCLFTIVPNRAYVTVDRYTYTQDHVTWDTQEVVPIAFSHVLHDFEAELRDAERSFAPLREKWDMASRLAHAEASLARTRLAAAAWDRVHLPERQKLELLRRMELFEGRDPAAPSGLLLFGPPGTGKTLIARTLADTLNCDFQKLTLAYIKEDKLGASGKRVRAIWDRARSHRPAIIFIDECDSVFGNRGAAETDAFAKDILDAFLPEWDGIEPTPGIMVIGATNRRDTLDDAIVSRFGWEMEVFLPGASDRRNILDQELKATGVDLRLPEELGSLIQGMSGRDLRNLAAATKSLAHPNAPSVEDLIEAVAMARKKGNAQVTRTQSWDALPLDASSLERLELISVLLKDVEKWRAQGVGIPRSLLLTGPDGYLMRQIAQALSNESGLAFLAPTLSDMKANFSGQSGNRVKLLFARARGNSPAILFIDRMDKVLPSRSSPNATDPFTNEVIAQVVQECDRLQSSDTYVLLLGATSNPEEVDPEVLGCFSERMAVPLPSKIGRIKVFTRLLADKKISFALDDGALLLAQHSEGKRLGIREIENWVESAEQKALLRAIRNGGPEHYVIALDDFEIVIP